MPVYTPHKVITGDMIYIYIYIYIILIYRIYLNSLRAVFLYRWFYPLDNNTFVSLLCYEWAAIIQPQSNQHIM